MACMYITCQLYSVSANLSLGQFEGVGTSLFMWLRFPLLDTIICLAIVDLNGPSFIKNTEYLVLIVQNISE